MVIRSSILLITFILICLHIDNLGIFASINDSLEKSEKHGDEKSTLAKPDLLTLIPITDSLEVSFTCDVLLHGKKDRFLVLYVMFCSLEKK